MTTAEKDLRVIILDWDDTLFVNAVQHPSEISNAIEQNQSLFDYYESQWTLYESTLVKYLTALLDAHLSVWIVTSASYGWIEWTAATYLRKVVPLLRRIPCLSAHHIHQLNHTTTDQVHMYEWKECAFDYVIAHVVQQAQMNQIHKIHVLTIADTTHEEKILANLNLPDRYEWIRQSILLPSHPSVSLLTQELQMLTQHVSDIWSATGSFIWSVQSSSSSSSSSSASSDAVKKETATKTTQADTPPPLEKLISLLSPSPPPSISSSSSS
jgi:hypothetical protein